MTTPTTTPPPKPDDGGPAFACAVPAVPMQHDLNWQGGMSLRAYLAGRAMQGLLSNPNCDGDIDGIANDAVVQTDALIERLKR